ncbi:hypothetical protein [Alicyclobacillus macrosporangiidus]|uniref:Uncharacterized protein n=1 Tax=Alicyclobacillus macrosporangiidus TaxID=392015 RepID=A0A1I7FC34_9BACL|nr:hypothetical protein [Alicyclobacillus macrosporangiidus]SFU33734.1 hypothetical protein SAMN05421543_101172 [Alicyclobacillus macrosporangiidus]
MDLDPKRDPQGPAVQGISSRDAARAEKAMKQGRQRARQARWLSVFSWGTVAASVAGFFTLWYTVSGSPVSAATGIGQTNGTGSGMAAQGSGSQGASGSTRSGSMASGAYGGGDAGFGGAIGGRRHHRDLGSGLDGGASGGGNDGGVYGGSTYGGSFGGAGISSAQSPDVRTGGS